MFTPNYKRLLFESALALKILESGDCELMYLDEFSIKLRNKSVYGWGPKGDYGFQQIHTEDFNMSFIIGFSIRRIYGIFGTTATHNHKSFITFITFNISWIICLNKNGALIDGLNMTIYGRFLVI